MKKLLFTAGLLSVHFAFSNTIQKKNLLENKALKVSRPSQDVLEVVEEVTNNKQPAENETQVSLQLMETKKIENIEDVETRRLAQTPEPAPSEPAKKLSQEKKPAGDLKSLVHESLFEKLRIRRDLDVFNEDQEHSSLKDEETEVQEDFGNVEVHWKHQKVDQK